MWIFLFDKTLRLVEQYLLCGLWDLPRPEIEPVSPTLASGFFTTESGKPEQQFLKDQLQRGTRALKPTGVL